MEHTKELGEGGLENKEEIQRLYTALSEGVDPRCVDDWMNTANKAFNGLKPLEVIERGEIWRLWDMAFRLKSGMPG